jgi:formate/nitrite transporter FocA (FNT family)
MQRAATSAPLTDAILGPRGSLGAPRSPTTTHGRGLDERGPAQGEFLKAEYVPRALAEEGHEHLDLGLGRAIGSALPAGAFVTSGALPSILVPAGVETEGITLLLQGLAFAVGYYYCVALAGVALFTEANISLPDVFLQRNKPHVHLARFWFLTFVFNFVGAFVVGWMIYFAQNYSPEAIKLLEEIVAINMVYMERGGVDGWFSLVLSAMLANWMVGLAFFFATMAQNVWNKFVPSALAVLLFEAANFQHSPANMAYFRLIMPAKAGPAGVTRSCGTFCPLPSGTSWVARSSSPSHSDMSCEMGKQVRQVSMPAAAEWRTSEVHDRGRRRGRPVRLEFLRVLAGLARSPSRLARSGGP